MCESIERQTGALSQDEIVVTPQMIEAAEDVVARFLPDVLDCTPPDLLASSLSAVFLKMWLVHSKGV